MEQMIPEVSFERSNGGICIRGCLRMTVGKLVRRVAPTISRLTYNPLFKKVVDSFDLIPRLIWRELGAIPPNHMRIRIGVGNRIFTNQLAYLTWSRNFWLHVFHSGLCRLDSTIVDIGCGCGRYAQVLRDYRFRAERFQGRYVGVDVDEEMLDWCRRNYDADRFSFHRSPHGSGVYGSQRPAESHANYRLPLDDGSTDFVFSTSLLTHLLEEEVLNYCRESYRVLKPGAHMLMSCFSIDHPPPTFGDRHTFRHRIGNAYVESLRVHEAAVAYEEQFLVKVGKETGFLTTEIQTAPGDWQPALLCRK